MSAAEATILKQLARDVSFLKERVIQIQIDVNEINSDMHDVKPTYVEKIKKIDKVGKFKSFSSVKELRKDIENS